ncbi:tetratricopeptide repeat protein [Streptomyces sp. NPDC059679]|uniref:tetratricopeptide repeat protein n=1 Tax=Streptomyces sp. NPDC059679 TaxID=3346903 RepID=UPI00367B2A07
MVVTSVADRARQEFVKGLLRLRNNAHATNVALHRASKRLVEEGTPAVRVLSTTGLSKLLREEGKEVPDWDLVRTFVLACKRHASDTAVPLEPAEANLRVWDRRLSALQEVLRLLDEVGGGDGQEVAATVPRASLTLPAAPSVFTGRDGELRRLLDVLAPPRGDGPSGAVVSAAAAVAGMGGIGKTALALAASHHAVDHGWFTDTYSVNLRGYDPVPVTAHQALESLLRAMDTAPEDIPPTQPEREGTYRSALAALARTGRRVLILADNASDSDQILPLLPGPGPHRLLATSRHTHPRLASQGALLVDLSTLQPGPDGDPAVDLLRDVLRRAGRELDDQEAAERLVALCGRVPLVLHIAAGLLILEPGRTLAGLTADLAGADSRLNHLDDGERALRAAFDLSYRHLQPDTARLFRLLALNPGPDLGLPAVAALTDEDGLRIRAGLRELVRGHLLESADERWSMHDLVRDYAMHHARSSDPAEVNSPDGPALLRLLNYYADGAQAANAYLAAPLERIADAGDTDRFDDRGQALAWLRAEHANLLAVPQAAMDMGELEIAIGVLDDLCDYLTRGRYFDDLITVSTTAYVVAHLTGGHPRDIAIALRLRGQALTNVRRFEEAERLLRVAADVFRLCSDDVAAANALNDIGTAQRGLRRFEQAVETHAEAAELSRNVGHQPGYVAALQNQGNSLQELRRYSEAIPLHTKVADISLRLKDDRLRANACLSLCNALCFEGRYEEAEAAITTAIDLYESLGDEYTKVCAEANRAGVLLGMGRRAEGTEAHRAAADMFRELGDEHDEAGTRYRLALALAEDERLVEAIAAFRMAADIFHQLGDRYEEARSRLSLGTTLMHTADWPQGFQELNEAVQAYAETGAAVELGTTFELLASLHEALNQRELARESWLAAVQVYEAAGDEESAVRAHRAADAVQKHGHT